MSTATATIRPEQVLKDLHKLWVDLAREDKEKGAAGVLRACAMTFIVAVEEQEHAQSAGESIANLIHQHPSRAIVMRVVTDAQDSFDARVLATCWMPFGKRQQICCEQIEITASKSRLEDLPNFILGLIAPDLPVVLWCRSEALCRDASFQKVFPLTDKIILDSSSFEDPAAALTFIQNLTAAGRNIGDLAWARITPIRETVAQIFEPQNVREHLQNLQKITIESSGAGVDYLLRWFRTSLPVHVEAKPGTGVPTIRFEGPDFTASLQLQDGIAEMQVNGLTRRVPFPVRSDCDLLREELSIIAADPIYRRCLL